MLGSEWDMTDCMEKLERFVCQSALDVLQEYSDEILYAWEMVYGLEKTAYEEGILALEDAIYMEEYQKMAYYEAFKEIILQTVGAMDCSLLLEIVTNNIYVLCKEPKDVFVWYLYLLLIRDVVEPFWTNRNVTAINPPEPSEVMKKHLLLFPEEYRKKFAEVL